MIKQTNDIAYTPEELSELVALCASFTHDPVGFVWAAFPWGVAGTELADRKPDAWQLDVMKQIASGLLTIEDAIRIAVSSGHGIGKSALVCWLIIWAMATHEDTKGVVTANTQNQLMTKTWAELSKWHRLSICRPLFNYTATAYYSADKDHEKTWRIDAIPWSKDNSEAFAGLHNQGKRILVIFDEASAIDDVIWEVVEGALTDSETEILWCCFGNPTRPNGRFFECFKRFKMFWRTRQIDSRTVAITNKKQLNSWVDAYGEDSDFVKVRVRGVFPTSGDNQLISSELVDKARDGYKVLQPSMYSFAPVIMGIDPSWTGTDPMVVVIRQGIWSKILMELPRNDDDSLVAGKIAYLMDKHNVAHAFIDQGYGTGIYSCLKERGYSNLTLINFGGAAREDRYANKRAEMWDSIKDWLKEGGCIEDREDFADELTSPEAFVNRKGRLQLESKDDMKARGLPSPNIADALGLTFAEPVRVSAISNFKNVRMSGRIRKAGSM